MNKDLSVSLGGVRVHISTASYGDIPAVEEVGVETPEYDLILTERRDVEYNDTSITVEQLGNMVGAFTRLIELLKEGESTKGIEDGGSSAEE